MHSAPDIDRLVAGFARALAAGRAAHAYVIVGDPRGVGGQLATRMAQTVLCSGKKPPCGECRGCRLAGAEEHIDLLVIEPESKSRVITIDRIREELIPRATQTAHEGGWKVIILRSADRLQDQAANALLKTLEEPPPKTLFLLVTDAPQFLLPTIASRCQRLVAGGSGTTITDPALREKIQSVLAAAETGGSLERMGLAAGLKALLDDRREAETEAIEAELDEAKDDKPEKERKKAEAAVIEARVNARVLELRRTVLGWMLEWQRDLLVLASGGMEIHHAERRKELESVAAGIGYGGALQRFRLAEEMILRLDRNLSEESVFRAFFREMPLAPPAAAPKPA